VGAAVGVEFLPTLTDPMVQAVQLIATGGGLIAGPHIVARAGEKHVTPIADPRDNDGNPLVPEKVYQPESYSI
jgi:hypothetical protein